MALRTNLQMARKRAGFKSAREFATYAGINVNTYTNYEQGKANMSLLQAWEFADLLHCTLDELAGRRVPEGPYYSDPRQQEANEIWDHVNEPYRVQMWEHAKVIDMAYDKSTQRNSVQEVAV